MMCSSVNFSINLLEDKKEFTVISCLKAHKASKHDGVKYKCDFCDMQVVCKSSLKHHILLKHSKHNNTIITCKHCEEQFQQMEAYTDHIKNIHFR